MMPMRDQAADIQANMYLTVDNAQRGTETAFHTCMDQLAAARRNDSSDWSERASWTMNSSRNHST